MNLTESILVIISVLLIMLRLNQMVGVFPSVIGCLLRKKECVNIEDSVKLARARDNAALVLFLPFTLIAAHYGVYEPRWQASMPENSEIWLDMAVFFVFYLIRLGLYFLVFPKKGNIKEYKIAYKTGYSYFIFLTALLLALVGVMSFMDMEPEVIKSAIHWGTVAVYLLLLVRKTQFFVTSAGILTGFLYLCTLELIPTGLLVVSAILF